jgi:HPt (histidine-containing phosphotransfer) domain-containing protein
LGRLKDRPTDPFVITEGAVTSQGSNDAPAVLTGPVGFEKYLDQATLKRLVTLFMEDSSERFTRIENAVAAQDAHQISLAAHAIKGGAGVVGAQVVRGLASRLEDDSRAGWDPALEPVIAELGASLEAVRAKATADGLLDT